jgi:hypothetical protein
MKESDLYPKIKAQWPGEVVRIDNPVVKGVADLVLVGDATIFAEVKIAARSSDVLSVSLHQRRFLERVRSSGGLGCVLVYVVEERTWYSINTEVVTRNWPHVRASQGTAHGGRVPSGLAASIT